MDWIFVALLIASALHMTEEYALPGGFPAFAKRMNPQYASLMTRRMAVVINGLQFVVCSIAIWVGTHALGFSLSVASLVIINGLVHFGASIRTRGYAPGVVTGMLVYLPLGAYAYYRYAGSGQMSLAEVIVSGMLGAAYMMVPLVYFVVGSRSVKR